MSKVDALAARLGCADPGGLRAPLASLADSPAERTPTVAADIGLADAVALPDPAFDWIYRSRKSAPVALPAPAQADRHRRSRGDRRDARGQLAVLLIVGLLLAVVGWIGWTSQHPVSAAVAAPVAHATVSGSGSLSYEIHPWQDYLTARIEAANTGNVGEAVKISAIWPQAGQAAITADRWVRLPYGAHRTVMFRTQAAPYQVEAFQASHSPGTVATAVIKKTFGEVHT
ncbi:MAG TPA: hypothetical protein VEG33_06635 [Streptosporangiaceae bacterium]|nr:hypothetical protein [Streptosporangiaceae bacterium]